MFVNNLDAADNLEKLLYLSGVAAEYLDYAGVRRLVPQETRLQLLRLAGHAVDCPEAVAAEVFALDAEPWRHWLQPFHILDTAAPLVWVRCHPDNLWQPLHWQLTLEEGTVQQGTFVPGEALECGNYVIDGVRYSARELRLDGIVPGYHQLRIARGEDDEQALLIACPPRCQELPGSGAGKKYWGINCQLYALRSANNWGIGDFGDLRELIDLAASAGADMIALNPLHAPCAHIPEMVSPYSPSDRRFLNPLYIAVEQLPGFALSPRLQAFFDASLAQQLAALRERDWVDYAAVTTLKYQALQLAYGDFVAGIGDAFVQGRARLRQFIDNAGAQLQQFARFESEHNPLCRDEGFCCYLQWLAREQLDACQHHARKRGMAIGLMGDLAVGSVAEGCEVSANPKLYVRSVTIGAPPDPFSSEGQDWGLPTSNPLAMAADHYQHFIQVLRANMAGAGALRIDHVMALMRLWWCLPKAVHREEKGTRSEEKGAHGEEKGVYVYYPLAALLPILRLESQRSQCVVVGEDMGVVPEDFRAIMAASAMYGNDLFYFNRHRDGRLKMPEEQREMALLSVTNHDVPTLFDWWSGEDLLRRRELGVIQDDDALATLVAERERERQDMLRWLAACNLLPEDRQTAPGAAFDMALCTAVHRACARGKARLMLLQLEDLQLLSLPINIPATSREYPNWRRKQGSDTATIFAGLAVQQLLQAVHEERQH